ncbi:MAG: magnesium transporter [Planctomycetota bacterium]
MQDDDKEQLHELRDLLKAATPLQQEDLAARLEPIHPADIAEWLQDLDPEERWTVYSALTGEKRIEVVEEAEDNVRADLTERMGTTELLEFVDELPTDEVVDLLEVVDDKVTETVLAEVDFEYARQLRSLAEYPPESAGSLMTTDILSVQTGTRIGDAIKQLKQQREELEEGVGLFVVDSHQVPVGYVPIRGLLTNSIHDGIESVMTEPFTVPVLDDQEEAANQIAKYSLTSLAVVDASGCLLGVITADDAQEVLESEASEDMMRLVGTAPVVGTEVIPQTRLPILTRVRHRIPLQAVTVLGGLVTAWILRMFLLDADGGGDSGNLALLRFLPIVIGLAGNVGVQASTILVRAFATGEVERDRELSVLTSEVLVGLLIGVLCGGTSAAVAGYMESGALLTLFGAAVGTAIAISVTWAAFLGCIVPMSCRRLGIDPAVVAGPFLITLSDISGSAIFILAATLILGQ